MKCNFAWQAWGFVALRQEVIRNSLIDSFAVSLGHATKHDIVKLWNGDFEVWNADSGV